MEETFINLMTEWDRDNTSHSESEFETRSRINDLKSYEEVCILLGKLGYIKGRVEEDTFTGYFFLIPIFGFEFEPYDVEKIVYSDKYPKIYLRGSVDTKEKYYYD